MDVSGRAADAGGCRAANAGRGQAVIIDALFFMLICGAAAGILFWASATYGEKSYNAYSYMYIND